MLDWISTKKELPWIGTTVLVYTDAGSYDLASLCRGDTRGDVCWEAERGYNYSKNAVDCWAYINKPEADDD